MKIQRLVLLILIISTPFFAKQRAFITGHAFKALADYVIESNSCNFSPQTIPEKSIIFVKTDFVPFFFEQIFPRLKNPIILITHNSDYSAPGKFASYLENPKIIMWFGQNKDIYYHPKFMGIPIGIANSEWPHGNQAVFNRILDSLETTSLQRIEKAYINFSSSTNPDRRTVLNLVKDKPFSFVATPKSIGAYLQEMSHFKYVISPFGNGLDCHRTWEALYTGCIPIVTTSTLDSLYEELPVIIFNTWKDLSFEKLQEKYLDLSKLVINDKKIYMDYWTKVITNFKR
jgi:hypothetical protein